MDETQGVQVKLCYHLTMRVIAERLRDALCGDAIQIVYLYLYLSVGAEPKLTGHKSVMLYINL